MYNMPLGPGAAGTKRVSSTGVTGPSLSLKSVSVNRLTDCAGPGFLMKTSFPSAWLSRTRLLEESVASESGSVRISGTIVLNVGFGDPPTEGVISTAIAPPLSTGATSNVVPLAFSVSETTVGGAVPGLLGLEALT